MPLPRLVKYLVKLWNRPKEFAEAVDKEFDYIEKHMVSDDVKGQTGTFTSGDTPAKTIKVVNGIITEGL